MSLIKEIIDTLKLMSWGGIYNKSNNVWINMSFFSITIQTMFLKLKKSILILFIKVTLLEMISFPLLVYEEIMILFVTLILKSILWSLNDECNKMSFIIGFMLLKAMIWIPYRIARYGMVHIGPPTNKQVDHPLSSGIKYLALYRAIWGYTRW